MKKGFIFDLDGVICFTDEYHYLAWKALADREGIYFDKDINQRLHEHLISQQPKIKAESRRMWEYVWNL